MTGKEPQTDATIFYTLWGIVFIINFGAKCTEQEIYPRAWFHKLCLLGKVKHEAEGLHLVVSVRLNQHNQQELKTRSKFGGLSDRNMLYFADNMTSLTEQR